MAECSRTLDRRQILKIGAVGLAGCFFPSFLAASVKGSMPQDRFLSLHNTHTLENLRVRYCREGKYCQNSLERINGILRDHRSGDVYPIAPRLLDLLFLLAGRLGADTPFHVISGYRSPATNAMLRKKTTGVASKSYHTTGRAIDIRLPGLKLARLRKAAANLKMGGVGFYPRSDFVHVDIGPVRYW